VHVDYEIHFQESWRVGSGEGAGPFVDSLVRRDGHRLPFVPGTTLRGLVVDALRDLCDALGVELCRGTVERRDEDSPPAALCGVTREGLCPICAIAGSPHRPGSVGWGAARLLLTSAGGMVERPEHRRELAEAAAQTPGFLTRAHPHTSIDHRSGRAAEERLFSLEEASAELVLAGRLELGADLAPDHVALLVAALRWLRELGGGRRRGLGGFRLHIAAAELVPVFSNWQDAVRHLEALGRQPERAAAPTAEAAVGASAPNVSENARPSSTALQIDVTVIGEVSLGRRPESGNQIAGLPFLPGSTLRGALAARWRGDRTSAEFERCFLSGRIRFGFLYPLRGLATALPARLSRHTCKLHPGPRSSFGHDFVDLLDHPEAERCPEPGCDGRLVPWGERFGEEIPELGLSPHNRIDPESKTVGQGALFAYEVLPEGTRLRGFLRADSADDLAILLAGEGLAAGEPFRLRAGRRKGSLGWLDGVVRNLQTADSGVGLFPDADPVPDPWPSGAALRLDLLTPAIVFDCHLRPRRHLLPEDFGLARERFDGWFGATAVLAGWNVAHGLPKADLLAVAAGSSCLLKDPTKEELAAVRSAALAGIGWRREEGFGAFAASAAQPAERD